MAEQMSKAYQAASWAVNVSNDPAHGYSQANRWGPDYDCSSFVIQAYEQADVPVKRAGANRTSDMKAAFLACGFKDVTNQVNLVNGYGLELGDVLLNEQNHAAMALDNGQVVHARSSEGNSIPGDQSGNEIRIQPYWNFPWNCVLRYEEKEEQNNMQGVDISNYQRGLTIQQLRQSGKAFAILKITEGSSLMDASAFDFYKEAYETGFPVGAYCYSHAINGPQAMAEAKFLLDRINKFPMPCGIFIDIETEQQLNLPAEQLKQVILGWCAAIGGSGYLPGVYSSEGTLWSKISPDDLPTGVLVWVAKWGNTQPKFPCDIWQNSDTGRIEGFAGNVDMDVALSDRFQYLIANASYNRGNPQPEEPEEDLAPDACPIQSIDPVISTLQFIMNSRGYWDNPINGIGSDRFFNSLQWFVDDLREK